MRLCSCWACVLCTREQRACKLLRQLCAAGDGKPGGWGSLGDGLLSCFWKSGARGSTRWFQGLEVAGGCGCQLAEGP